MSNNDLKGGNKNDGKGRLQKRALQLFDSSIQKRQAVRNLDLMKKGLQRNFHIIYKSPRIGLETLT
jgi:hypothetical protein